MNEIVKILGMTLPKWINENTSDSNTVVELGAGFFKNLGDVHPKVKHRIGVEIYWPYIENATYNDCVKIEGDLMNYQSLLNDIELDTVLIADVLEHFDKEEAFLLVEKLKKDFNKILLMLPIGVHKQDRDVTGFGGHTSQTHRSYWFEEDVAKLMFDENIIDPNFHKDKENSGCYFGIWKK